MLRTFAAVVLVIASMSSSKPFNALLPGNPAPDELLDAIMETGRPGEPAEVALATEASPTACAASLPAASRTSLAELCTAEGAIDPPPSITPGAHVSARLAALSRVPCESPSVGSLATTPVTALLHGNPTPDELLDAIMEAGRPGKPDEVALATEAPPTACAASLPGASRTSLPELCAAEGALDSPPSITPGAHVSARLELLSIPFMIALSCFLPFSLTFPNALRTLLWVCCALSNGRHPEECQSSGHRNSSFNLPI